MEQLPLRLDDLISYIKEQHPDGDALQHLSDAVIVSERIGEIADHLIGHFVDQARRTGASWTEIGQSMGVTKQAAQKRFVIKETVIEGPDASEPQPGSWSRFTDRAKVAIIRASSEARNSGSDVVDTEHVLLGVLHEPENLASRAIVALGVPLETVREALIAAGRPPAQRVPEHIPFTARAKKVHELAVREALRLGHNYVGTEHILLALVVERDGTAGQVLTGLGLTHERLDEQIGTFLQALRHRA